MGIGNFSDRELKIIELRTQGVKTPQIAKTFGIPKNTAYEALWKIYRKVGVDDVVLLTRWAIKWGLDEPLEPERPRMRRSSSRRSMRRRYNWDASAGLGDGE
jgi:DNA-binding CsgD family transcriptional regulator